MFRVSRLLAANGLVDPFWFTEASRERGRVVHSFAEAVWTPGAEEPTCAPAFDGYFDAVLRAALALKLVPICAERRLTAFGVTGRPDVIGWLPAAVGRLRRGPAIVDVKTGDRAPTHGIQLAFYEMLADEWVRADLPADIRALPWQRIGLYVKESGRYALHVYDNPDDRSVAHAILDLTRWKISRGLLRQDELATIDDDPILPEYADGERVEHDPGSRQSRPETLPPTGA